SLDGDLQGAGRPVHHHPALWHALLDPALRAAGTPLPTRSVAGRVVGALVPHPRAAAADPLLVLLDPHDADDLQPAGRVTALAVLAGAGRLEPGHDLHRQPPIHSSAPCPRARIRAGNRRP